MNGYTIFALAFAPGAFWLWYFYKKDKLEPEPKSLILRVFALGMLAVIPTFFAEQAVNSVLSLFSPVLILVVGAPIIEELAKFLVVRFTIFRNKEFDEPMDGIVYAAAAALGFASLENFGYISTAYMNMLSLPTAHATSHEVFGISFTRAIFSVPGHVLFSVMWGYALGAAKFMHDPAYGRRLVMRGLILSMVLHGVFNSVLSFPLALGLLLIFMFIGWRMVRKRISTALMNSPFSEPDS